MRGGIDPGKIRLVSGLLELYIYGRIFDPGMGHYHPRVRRHHDVLSRGATLAARWLHESQPTINQPMGVGFPHLAGRYRPGGCLFSSLGCWSCRDTEEFIIRGWEPILSGFGLALCAPANQRSANGIGVSTPCGADSTRVCAGSTRFGQSAIGQWDWDFHTVRGGVDLGKLGVCPRGVGVVEIRRDF